MNDMTADAMVASGLAAVGYEYINIGKILCLSCPFLSFFLGGLKIID